MKFLFFLVLLFPGILSAQIDKMSINKINGGGDVMPLFNNQQITFQSATANDAMYIKKFDGTTDVYKLSDVNAIVINGVTGVVDVIAQLFKLENYPNPFKESTNITYYLEKQSKVELNILDINGNLINSLVNEIQEAGHYSKNWNGTNFIRNKVSNGSYFYLLKADGIIISKQTILIN